MKKVCNKILVSTIALILVLSLIFMNWKPNQISVSENRPLAEPVPLSQGLSNFMRGLDNSVNDRIGFRESMIQLYNRMNVELFQDGGAVILGKNGWLFYEEELPDYTGSNANAETVERYAQILIALDAWCESRGTEFVFIVGPNKSSIYSQYMPDYIQKAESSLLDQLLKRMEATDVTVICPKEEMIADSEKIDLYMKLDTHWNAYGAQYVMKELIAELELPQKEFKVSGEYNETGDLLTMLSVPSIGSASLHAGVEAAEEAMVEGVPGTKDCILTSPENNSFVCYHDSFSIALTNYYTHYFNGKMYWSFNVLNEMNQEPTDYLIFECTERYLSALDQCAAILG